MLPNRLESKLGIQKSINKFKSEINDAGICYMLNTTNHANPNDNLNILNEVISKAKDKHLPVRMIKFSKYKHGKSQWITKGIIRSIAYKDKLYMKLKQTPTDSDQYINHKINFATYQRIVKKFIRNAKKTYYQNRFEKCKNDIKQTWCTIKEVINRTSKKLEFPDHFLIDNKLITDTSVIANKFNYFFTNVGPKLVAEITNTDNANFMDYLHNPIYYIISHSNQFLKELP